MSRHADPSSGPPGAEPPEVSVRCFGGLAAYAGDAPVDLVSLRPRARQLLALLAVNARRPVHREVIAAALWPDVPGTDVWRRIHVAVSCVRRVFGPELPAVTRQDDGYVLALDVDVSRFDERATEAARMRGRAGERRVLTELTEAYVGDLLPEAGPAEWVVHERYHRRAVASDAYERLAALTLADGDAPAAVDTVRRGLRVDPYRDGLWQTLFTGLRQCGHAAALARARSDYATLLAGADRL